MPLPSPWFLSHYTHTAHLTLSLSCPTGTKPQPAILLAVKFLPHQHVCGAWRETTFTLSCRMPELPKNKLVAYCQQEKYVPTAAFPGPNHCTSQIVPLQDLAMPSGLEGPEPFDDEGALCTPAMLSVCETKLQTVPNSLMPKQRGWECSPAHLSGQRRTI